MPKFYLTGTSPEGQRKTECVEAQSAAESQQRLVDQGWSDIVIHTDDIMAIHQIDIPNNLFSPDEMLKMGRMTSFQNFCFMLKKLYSQSPGTSLVAALFVAFGISAKKYWAVGMGAAWLGFPILLALFSAIGNRGKRNYDALLFAAAWFQWDEVERLLPLQSSKLPVAETAFRAAQVTAVRGHIESALEQFDLAVENADIPEWFVHTRRADLYLTANKGAWAAEYSSGGRPRTASPFVDEAIRCYEQAIELAPDQPASRIDLAKAVLKYRQDVQHAQRLLDAVRPMLLTELPLLFVGYLDGILALEKNSPLEAIALLTEFQKKVSQVSVNPQMDSLIDEVRSFLTLAYAAAGDETRALAEFRRCKPRLIAVHEVELLTRCRKALGLAERD